MFLSALSALKCAKVPKVKKAPRDWSWAQNYLVLIPDEYHENSETGILKEDRDKD